MSKMEMITHGNENQGLKKEGQQVMHLLASYEKKKFI